MRRSVNRALVSQGIQALTPYEPGKPIEELSRELGVNDPIKLASNENPLGPSPLALAAVVEAAGALHRYPDAAAHHLRRALATELQVELGEVVVGNGSNEILELLVRTFTSADSHIVFADPSFVVYAMAAQAHGVPHTAVPLRNFTHDLDAMARAVRDDTALVFIANPNNPTGTYVTRAELSAFLAQVPEDVVVAVDEAYFEYADAPDYPNCLELRHLHPRLVVLRTFSKIYGLAALRLGYAVVPGELAEYLNRVRAPFNTNSLAQVAGVAALADRAHVAASQALNRTERRRLAEALSELGWRVVPSQANFLFVDVGRPARPVYQALLRQGCIVRAIGDSTFLRITVGLPSENDRLLRLLRVLRGGSE